MYVGKLNIPYKSSVNFIILSDLHYGSNACDIDRFKKVVNKYLEDNYWFALGDMLDSIITSDKRFDYRSCEVDDILTIADELINILKPYSSNCLGYITGNHEEALRRKTQIDISQYIANMLGVQYMGYSAYLLLRFYREHHSELWKLYLTHGSYSGAIRYGKIRKLESLANIYDADIYICGHVHDLLYTDDMYYTLDNNGNLQEKHRYYIIAGSYLKPFDNYVEYKGIKPSRLGSPILTVYPEKRKVDITFVP